MNKAFFISALARSYRKSGAVSLPYADHAADVIQVSRWDVTGEVGTVDVIGITLKRPMGWPDSLPFALPTKVCVAPTALWNAKYATHGVAVG